ncbi:MAG: hypothetical protein H7122_14885 [Chitinophagaceae bacterium]|nr:hypothetical protein [Chitinophagaceae bacterium]
MCLLAAGLNGANAQISFTDFSANRLLASTLQLKGFTRPPVVPRIFFGHDTAGKARFYTSRPVPLIAEDHYSQNFGFFCRKELQFEKQTKLPLRFRLGSIEYCNYLEDKR